MTTLLFNLCIPLSVRVHRKVLTSLGVIVSTKNSTSNLVSEVLIKGAPIGQYTSFCCNMQLAELTLRSALIRIRLSNTSISSNKPELVVRRLSRIDLPIEEIPRKKLSSILY